MPGPFFMTSPTRVDSNCTSYVGRFPKILSETMYAKPAHSLPPPQHRAPPMTVAPPVAPGGVFYAQLGEYSLDFRLSNPAVFVRIGGNIVNRNIILPTNCSSGSFCLNGNCGLVGILGANVAGDVSIDIAQHRRRLCSGHGGVGGQNSRSRCPRGA